MEGNLFLAKGPVKAKVDRASFRARPGEGWVSAGLCGQCSPESSDGFPPATLTASLPEHGPERALAGLGSIARTLVFRTQRLALRLTRTARCLSF